MRRGHGTLSGEWHVFGKVVSDSFNEAAMTEALGERWEVMRRADVVGIFQNEEASTRRTDDQDRPSRKLHRPDGRNRDV